MLVIPTNRQVNGIQIRVTNPVTKRLLPITSFDLDTIEGDELLHYLRAIQDGDLEVLPTTPTSEGVE
jgi:hypothetical protein